jgi:predicted nicotinamide N-methyase
VTEAGIIDAEAFLLANTAPGRAALVPEFELRLANAITPIWQATEDFLNARNIAPPFWAFAWPGSQALARTILDDPACVRGARVLDFAAGCGLAALACASACAASVEACEIDPLAVAAIAVNARRNGLPVKTLEEDVVGTAPGRWDLILCGDVCYEGPMTRHIMPWLQRQATQAIVWVADPGRAYLPPPACLQAFAHYDVPTTLELEDHTSRRTTLYRLLPA